jgi:hypothetical protein
VAEIGVDQKDCRRAPGKHDCEVNRNNGFSLAGYWAGDEHGIQSSLFPHLQETLAKNPETFLCHDRESPKGKNTLLGLRLASYLLCMLDELRQ